MEAFSTTAAEWGEANRSGVRGCTGGGGEGKGGDGTGGEVTGGGGALVSVSYWFPALSHTRRELRVQRCPSDEAEKRRKHGRP